MIAGDMDRQEGSTSLEGVVRALAFACFLFVAWTATWVLEQSLEPHVALLATGGGRFAYWFVMRMLLWILPALAVIRASGSTLREVMRFDLIRAIILWGGGAGLVLGIVALLTKTFGHQPLFASHLGLPLLNAVLIAPVVEEIVFRGAILGGLTKRLSFWRANIITGLVFAGIHCPGWYFQGVLWANLKTPAGGALSIFLLGLLFGYVAHKSKSVAASTLTHMLNNLFSG